MGRGVYTRTQMYVQVQVDVVIEDPYNRMSAHPSLRPRPSPTEPRSTVSSLPPLWSHNPSTTLCRTTRQDILTFPEEGVGVRDGLMHPGVLFR